MNFLTRATNHAPLTPAERSWLKLLKGTVISAVLAGATAVYPMVFAGLHTSPDWKQVALVFVSAFTMTMYQSVEKWCTAHLDPPLSIPTGLPTEHATPITSTQAP